MPDNPSPFDATLKPEDSPPDGRTLVPTSPPPLTTPETDTGGPTLAGLANDRTLDATDPASLAIREAALAAAQNAGPTATAFGDYDLLEPIAKGGMGIVYKARQRKLNRIVAIKMILAGQFADQSDIERFYSEAEAAAALSHPNIVAIHEIGEVGGQHFFSMDYIDGQSLADMVRENPLRPRRAAEFVKTIAETIQFAHDNGVIHRDLKPANILLDRRQRPLVTDFGLAKQVSSQSQRTMAGSIVGTPSYMSPEQAAGHTDQIGPLSDLYSLGAILYELLTGRPPFRAASPFETVRQVLDSEPVSPRVLNESVPRDLETICLKCLQKDRKTRYGSAQELADELDRYLRGEPIQARPISGPERFWRLCRRYPVTSSAIAAAVAFFIALPIVLAVAYFRISAALERESIARVESDRSFREAVDAVNDLFTTVSENTLLNQPGMQPLRQELLQKPLDYYQRFLTQRGSDPRVPDELGGAYYRVAQITELLKTPDEALPAYESAKQIQSRQVERNPGDAPRLEALGNTLNALGTVWVKKKEFDKADKEFEAAIDVRSRLANDHATQGDYQRALANTHMNVGMSQYKRGRLQPAREHFEQAQAIRRSALAANPTQPKLQRDLAKGYYNLGFIEQSDGDLAAAEAHFKSAVATLEALTTAKHTDLDNFDIEKLLAVCYRILGDLLPDERQADRRRYYEQALAHLVPLASQNPAVSEFQTEQGAVLLNLSDLELASGDSPAARTSLDRAREIYQTLVQHHPDDPWFQRDLAVTLRELAKLQHSTGDHAAGAASLQEAKRLLTNLVTQKPNELEFKAALEATKAVTIPAVSDPQP